MDVTLPDGTVIKDVPEGTTKVQLAAKLKASGYDIGKLRPEPQPMGMKDAMLSLVAPGGISRMAEQASNDFGRFAYNTGGAVTDAASKVLPPMPSALIGTAANVGLQAIPMMAGGEVGRTAKPAFEWAAKGLMGSALKPTLKMKQTGQAERAVDTLLDEGINVSKGGVEKLQGKIDEIENAVDQALKGSNATVDKKAVASRVMDLINKIDKTNPTPAKARAAAEEVYNEFVTNFLVPNKIPVERANEMKRTIYNEVKKSYGQMGSESVEAKKALARGFKEELAAVVPGMDLSKQAELINALNVVERRALMQINNNPAGLALLAKNPEAAVSFLADKSSLFKSIVARMLNAGSEIVPGTAGRIVAGTIAYPAGQPPRN